jgi:hypothetical protein
MSEVRQMQISKVDCIMVTGVAGMEVVDHVITKSSFEHDVSALKLLKVSAVPEAKELRAKPLVKALIAWEPLAFATAENRRTPRGPYTSCSDAPGFPGRPKLIA